MLGKPKDGFTEVKVGSQKIGDASAIDDVPMDTLDAFLKYYYYHAPFQVTYDAVDYYFGLFCFCGRMYIISNDTDDNGLNIRVVKPEGNRFGTRAIAMNVVNRLANECVNDIRKYIDEWVSWYTLYELTDERMAERKQILLGRADILERFVKTEKLIDATWKDTDT